MKKSTKEAISRNDRLKTKVRVATSALLSRIIEMAKDPNTDFETIIKACKLTLPQAMELIKADEELAKALLQEKPKSPATTSTPKPNPVNQPVVDFSNYKNK